MIEFNDFHLNEIKLVGRIIFHASSGSDHSMMLSPNKNLKIGAKLGTVTRITSPSRIYYLNDNATEKYVNNAGIGFICDSEEEAKALETLRDETTQKIRAFAESTYCELKANIEQLNAE